MFTRPLLRTVAATTALFAFASANSAANKEPMHMMDHQEVTIVHLVETAQTAKDHEAVAKRFDEEAAKFDEQAAYHESLAKKYRSGVGMGPKGNPAAMAGHCDNLVKSLKASAADAREMASLHRGIAQALAK